MQNHKYNRRIFIKSALSAITLGIMVMWSKMVSTQKKLIHSKTTTIPFEISKEITFANNYIIINKDGRTKVFSSRCTHLGCKIETSKNNQLLCPCHGSIFSLEGKAVKGPAISALQEMKFEIDKSNTIINITN